LRLRRSDRRSRAARAGPYDRVIAGSFAGRHEVIAFGVRRRLEEAS
jgi:hypothetical protein